MSALPASVMLARKDGLNRAEGGGGGAACRNRGKPVTSGYKGETAGNL